MMQPLKTSRQIVPSDIGHVLERCAILARKETQKQLVSLVNSPVGLGIYIIEIQGVTLKIGRQLKKHVHIGSAGRNQKRGFILYDRSFERGLGRKESDACAPVEFTFVARPTDYIKYRRRCSAILSWEQSLIERGRNKSIAVESREETSKMAHIIYWRHVNKYLVLSRSASTNLKTAGCIALGLYTRKQLHRPHHVLLAEYLRRRRKILYLYLLCSSLDLTESFLSRIRLNHNLVKLLLTQGI